MDDPAIWLAATAALASGFFAACSTALRVFSRTRFCELLETLGREDQYEPFMAKANSLSLMVGALRTFANLLVLSAVIAVAERWYPATGYQFFTQLGAFAATLAIVSVVGVAVPMSFGRYHAEWLLAHSMGVLARLLWLLTPLVKILTMFDPVVRRVTGVDERPENGNDQLSDEVMSVVEQHQASRDQPVDDIQKSMIEAVFDFPTTTTGEIMTPRTDVQGMDVTCSLEEVKSFIQGVGHSRIPVYEGDLDHILGLLYAKDLIRLLGDCEPSEFDLRSILRTALMVPETKPVGELLAEFRAKQVHIAIVLDEYGGTAGLITIEDILEELVGEIADEFEDEKEEPTIVPVSDQVYDVAARVYVDDLNDELDLSLPEDEDYDTVGGFVFTQLGHIPEVGESFDYEGARITVSDAERTRINRVRIELNQVAAADAPAGN